MAKKQNPMVNSSLDPTMTGWSLQHAFDVCKLVREAACSCGAPKTFTESLFIAMREIQSCICVCNSHIKDCYGEA